MRNNFVYRLVQLAEALVGIATLGFYNPTWVLDYSRDRAHRKIWRQK